MNDVCFISSDQREDISEMETVLNNRHLNGKPMSNGRLIDKSKENENQPLKGSQKLLIAPFNKALSQPDIFYSVRNKFAINFSQLNH